jgi:hypothetical protein
LDDGLLIMAQVKKKIIKNKNLTIFKVTGKFTSDEIIRTFDEFYNSKYTLNILWDLSESDFSELDINHLRRIISAAKEYAHLRVGGRTALYTTLPLGFGLARMYESLSEANQVPILNRVFRDIHEAMAWLES